MLMIVGNTVVRVSDHRTYKAPLIILYLPSRVDAIASVTMGLMWFGHHTIPGSLCPPSDEHKVAITDYFIPFQTFGKMCYFIPSHVVPLPHRRCPALPPKPCRISEGPLSEDRKIMVFSSSPVNTNVIRPCLVGGFMIIISSAVPVCFRYAMIWPMALSISSIESP